VVIVKALDPVVFDYIAFVFLFLIAIVPSFAHLLGEVDVTSCDKGPNGTPGEAGDGGVCGPSTLQGWWLGEKYPGDKINELKDDKGNWKWPLAKELPSMMCGTGIDYGPTDLILDMDQSLIKPREQAKSSALATSIDGSVSGQPSITFLPGPGEPAPGYDPESKLLLAIIDRLEFECFINLSCQIYHTKKEMEEVEAKGPQDNKLQETKRPETKGISTAYGDSLRWVTGIID
jgi:hypothetical protein